MLADKPALVSIAEDVPRLPPAQRPGFLHGVGEHRHERPEPRVSAFDAAYHPGVPAVVGLALGERSAGPAQHPLPQSLQVHLQLGEASFACVVAEVGRVLVVLLHSQR